MFTPIKLQYLGTASLIGGRGGSISKEVIIDAVFTEGVKLPYNDRRHDLGAEATITILFEDEDEVTEIEPGKVRIQLIETSEYYEILDAKAPTKDLGLERTYILLVKRRKDR